MTPWCNTECGSSPSLLTSTSSLICWIQVERFRAFTFVTSHGILTDVTTEAIVNVAFIYVCRVKIKDNLNKMREKRAFYSSLLEEVFLPRRERPLLAGKFYRSRVMGSLQKPWVVQTCVFFREGRGEGKGAKKSFVQGGSAPRSNSLPFYIPFLTEKIPLLYTFYWQMVPLSHTLFRTFHPF